MTKEELKKLKETVAYFGHWYDVIGEERVSILEKSIVYIAELEAQIEKMKCCGNCAKRGHICVAEEIQGKLCGKSKDKWELRG